MPSARRPSREWPPRHRHRYRRRQDLRHVRAGARAACAWTPGRGDEAGRDRRDRSTRGRPRPARGRGRSRAARGGVSVPPAGAARSQRGGPARGDQDRPRTPRVTGSPPPRNRRRAPRGRSRWAAGADRQQRHLRGPGGAPPSSPPRGGRQPARHREPLRPDGASGRCDGPRGAGFRAVAAVAGSRRVRGYERRDRRSPDRPADPRDAAASPRRSRRRGDAPTAAVPHRRTLTTGAEQPRAVRRVGRLTKPLEDTLRGLRRMTARRIALALVLLALMVAARGLARRTTWYLASDQFAFLAFADDLRRGTVFHDPATFALLAAAVPPDETTDAYYQTYLWRDGRLWSRYPPGFPLLLAAAGTIGGEQAMHALNPLLYLVLLIALALFSGGLLRGTTFAAGAAAVAPWALLVIPTEV